MITQHQYLKLYPIDPDSRILILGTIHPHDHGSFKLPFFYGNELSLWKIFNEAFPEELPDAANLSDVLRFIKSKNISLSDTIVSCERIHPTALDKDLNPIELHREDLLTDIRKSKITDILCTSGFGKNNAFKLFYFDILGLKLTKAIRNTREVILNESVFGRPVRVRALYSPAKTALMGIGKSKHYKLVSVKYADCLHPVAAYRVKLYKEALNNVQTV